jgi:hypothetical protein
MTTAFMPDSSIVARVEPVAQFRRAHRSCAAGHDRAALHRDAVRARRARPPVRSKCTRLVALCRPENGSVVQLVPESQARVACRHIVLGRRHRHQFALDRHRDLQSRSRLRLSGLSAPADRSRDHAVPGDFHAQHHAGRRMWSRIPTWRRTANRIRARNFLGGGWPSPGSASGSSRRRSRTPAACVPGDSGDQVLNLQKGLIDYGYGVEATGSYDDATRDAVIAFPAPFPAGKDRRHRGHLDAGNVAQAPRCARDTATALPKSQPAAS